MIVTEKKTIDNGLTKLLWGGVIDTREAQVSNSAIIKHS